MELTTDGAISVRTQRQAEDAAETAQTIFRDVEAGQSVIINMSGVRVGERPILSFTPGANISLLITDDPVNNEIDIAISLVSMPDVASEYRVAGNKVVGARGAAVAAVTGTATAVYDATTQTLINDLKTAVNALRDRLRVTGGHGAISD